jgi:hypothetical protein
MTRALLALLLIAGQLPVAADHRVIVLLDRPRAAPIEQRNAARIYAKWRVVPGFAATVDDAELQRLRNDPDVLSVEPDLGGSVTAIPNGAWIGEELLESTGRPIVDSRNGITTPRLDLFAAAMKLRSNTTPAARRRAVRH